METIITPDSKFQTKNFYLHLMANVILASILSLFSLIIKAKKPDEVPDSFFLNIFLLMLILIWVIVFPLSRLWISRLSYVIRDEQVTIHKGVLTKTQQNIPFRAVTDFVLERDLFDRFLGIGSIKIQTAGQGASTGGYEGTLSGLLEYERLHSELRDRMKSLHQPSGPATTSEEPGEGDVFAAMLTELQAIRKAVEKG